MLTPSDLQSYIDKNDLKAELIYLNVPTPTVEAAAQAVGTQPERILKTLLFWIDDEPIVVIAKGPNRVEQRLLAGYFNLSRKRIGLIDAKNVLEITGYPVGAVPPVGHLRALKTLMDQSVLEEQEVYAGGGAENCLMRLSPAELLAFTGATVVDLQGSSTS